MKVIHGSAVFEELLNLSAYIAFENENAAQRFLDACNETFRFLAEHQHTGVAQQFRSKELQAVRRWRVKGFEKYLIFYLPVTDGVKILHIVHSARDYRTLFDEDS